LEELLRSPPSRPAIEAPFTSTVPADFHTPGQYTTGTVEPSMYLEYAPAR